jgi:hypothetical protein
VQQDKDNPYIKMALRELYQEYERCNQQRRLGLKKCLLLIEDNQSYWGLWNKETRVIRLAQKLVQNFPWHDVVGVLRHEMAHQYVDEILEQQGNTPHGSLFQKACERVGVPSLYSSATVDLIQNSLDWRQTKPSSEQEKLLDRVRKLLSLATSNNEHEALSAMNRVREIYAKYNLDESTATNEGFFHTIFYTNRKRLHTYEQKIMSILVNHYFVEVIVGSSYDYQKQSHFRTIELIGRRENVLMAEYVFEFLKRVSLEIVQNKKEVAAKNMSTKAFNTFHLGILSGFDEKLTQQAVSPEGSEIKKALQFFKKDPRLKKYISTIYPRLISVSSRARLRDNNAYEEGRREGQKITIQKPFEKARDNFLKFLK